MGLCENVVKIPGTISDYNNNHVPIISWPWGYTPVTHPFLDAVAMWQRKIHLNGGDFHSEWGKAPFRKGISHGFRSCDDRSV